MSKLRKVVLVLATVLGLVAVSAAPSFAAFPGKGRLVAFQYQNSVWTMQPQRGATPHRLGAGGAPRWSPDGKKIAFERQSNIFVMNANGSGVHQVTFNGASHQPAWSPDGKKLVFVVVQHPHGDLFTMAATGGTMTRLTNDAATTCGDDRPTWSPKGGIVLFRQTLCSGSTRIKTVNVSTHKQSLVVGGGYTWEPPDISPNGQRVVVVRDNPCDVNPSLPAEQCVNDILTMNLDGSHQTHLLNGVFGVELPYPQNDVAASPSSPAATALPIYVVYEEQLDANREPCGLSNTPEFDQFFSSMTSCPSFPDWQP